MNIWRISHWIWDEFITDFEGYKYSPSTLVSLLQLFLILFRFTIFIYALSPSSSSTFSIFFIFIASFNLHHNSPNLISTINNHYHQITLSEPHTNSSSNSFTLHQFQAPWFYPHASANIIITRTTIRNL